MLVMFVARHCSPCAGFGASNRNQRFVGWVHSFFLQAVFALKKLAYQWPSCAVAPLYNASTQLTPPVPCLCLCCVCAAQAVLAGEKLAPALLHLGVDSSSTQPDAAAAAAEDVAAAALEEQ